jgi:hypothetical protein
MSTRLLILAAVVVIAASPLLSSAWQDPVQPETQKLVPMYDYGTVYVSRRFSREKASIAFGLELGPDQSWHFRTSGRIARLVEAANETSWEPELLEDDGDTFANAMLNDLKLHPDRLPSMSFGLHELGSYGWEVFQVERYDDKMSTGGIYHVRRVEMRAPIAPVRPR